MREWNALGMTKLASVKVAYNVELAREYSRLTGLRMGFLTNTDVDFSLHSLFLDLMALHHLDFTATYRLLAQFTSVKDDAFSTYLNEMVLPASQISEALRPHAVERWAEFFTKYEARLNLPAELAAASAAPSSASNFPASLSTATTMPTRAERQNAANPRFTLRQWVLEDIIAKLDTASPDVLALDQVLEMASEPYHSYGEAILGEEAVCGLDAAKEREKELCGLGSSAMLGFQCSCSS